MAGFDRVSDHSSTGIVVLCIADPPPTVDTVPDALTHYCAFFSVAFVNYTARIGLPLECYSGLDSSLSIEVVIAMLSATTLW